MTATVKRLERVAPEVFALDLHTPDAVPWTPGQWVSLHLPVGPHPPLVRAYSLAAPPDGTGLLPLVFDHVEGGFGSTYLAGLKPGDTVHIAGIVGKFVLPEADDVLFVARYTGIVPALCMIRHLCSLPSKPRVRLVYSALRPEDLVFHDEFTGLSAQPWFEYTPTVDYGDAHCRIAVRPAIGILQQIEANPDVTVPMVSGVRAFTQEVRGWFIERRGYERRGVKTESYD